MQFQETTFTIIQVTISLATLYIVHIYFCEKENNKIKISICQAWDREQLSKPSPSVLCSAHKPCIDNQRLWEFILNWEKCFLVIALPMSYFSLLLLLLFILPSIFYPFLKNRWWLTCKYSYYSKLRRLQEEEW